MRLLFRHRQQVNGILGFEEVGNRESMCTEKGNVSDHFGFELVCTKAGI